MIELNQEKIQKKVQDSPSGVSCVFIKLNKKVGLKLYYDEAERNYAYKMQQNAAKHGLGPDTYGLVDNISVSKIEQLEEWPQSDENIGWYSYGYLTEIVETHDKFRTARGEEFLDLFHKEILTLEADLDKIGFAFWDQKPENCGIKNHRLICIDFGDLDSRGEYNG